MTTTQRRTAHRRGRTSELDGFIKNAVRDGLVSARGLEKDLVALFDKLAAKADALEHEAVGDAGSEIVAQYSEACAQFRVEALDRTARQKKRLKTFNLVFFGRTGAGKSSLIEALSGGDGESISRGESDWTTEVRDVRWRSCLLVDTPGIAGWGRTVSRDELEARARTAVEDADVVLLCFDTQSQQAGEFARVAQWITAYAKPTIAILNCRNPRWRFPPRVASAASRRQLSQSVAEHAGNIGDELARIGLEQVPVLALSCKRAAFARTRDFTGPDAATRTKLRAEFGASALLAWSNLEALEQLLSAALSEHAEPIRLGMLREQTRGVLERARASLGDTVKRDATVLAEQIEEGITKVLELLGQPMNTDLKDGLSELERLRGRFNVSARGSFQIHAGHRLRAALREPRRDAQDRAERLVDRSFAERTRLSEREFFAEVIKPVARDAERAVDALSDELRAYLEKQLELLVADIHADLDAVIHPVSVEGDAGSTQRALGIGLEVGAGLGGIVGGVLMIGAATNWWNPVGWTSIGALAISGIAAKLFGGRARKKAAEKREQARTSARAEARRSVNGTFDAVEEQLLTDMTEIIQGALTAKLGDEIHRAFALRRTALAGQAATELISETLAGLGETLPTSGLLAKTAVKVQRRSHPREPRAARLLWLGEDWCADPLGLDDDTSSRQAPAEPARPRPNRAAGVSHARSLQLPPAPRAQTGLKWLAKTSAALEQDREARHQLKTVHQLADRARPILAIAGDYSSGKSTFVKRLLAEAGQKIPATLAVGGAPKTSTSRRYAWGAWDVVDTPGFQSTNRRHTLAARAALVNASAVVVLFNPNLVIGDPQDLQLLLTGDPDRGLIGKLDRTLFVINRSDELGVDPADDPEAFQNLCQRKRLELAQALASLPALSRANTKIDPDKILCTASDPFGLVGDRRHFDSVEYDDYRGWDGMADFVAAIGGPDAKVRNAVDVSVLHAGSSRLGELARKRTLELNATREQSQALMRLLRDLEAASTSGEALLHSARERLVTLTSVRVADLFDDVLAAPETKTRAARAKALHDWGSDALLQQQISEWLDTLNRDLAEWTASIEDRVERRLGSPSFVRAFPEITDAIDTSLLVEEATTTKGRAGRETAKSAGTKLGNMSKDTVLEAGHRIGYKFQPWEATKLTAKLNVAGGALGIVFGTAELVGVARSLGREKQDDRDMLAMRRDIVKTAANTAKGFFDSGNDTDQSPRAVVREALQTLNDTHEQVRERRRVLDDRRAHLKGQRDACRRAARDAERICA